VLVTHDLAEAARADRVIVLDRGVMVFSGSLAELMAKDDLLAECGLEVPPIALLAARLRDLGVAVSEDVPGPVALVDALCR
jgi:energy-coupling factor transport system ATP-binding protein